MRKKSRTERARCGAGALTERDFDVLTLLGLCRFASTAQVARDCFPSEDRARRRVRRLFDGGLVNVSMTSSTAPNLLSLTRQGLDALTAERPELAARVRMAGTIRLSEIERHLAAVDARLYAAAWGRTRGLPLLRWSPRHGSLARELGLPPGMEPDGIAEFGVTDRIRRYVAVEVAVAPEALRALPARLDGYAASAAIGSVWVVARDWDRAAHVARVAAERGIGVRVVAVDRAHLALRPTMDLPSGVTRRAEGPAAPGRGTGEGS